MSDLREAAETILDAIEFCETENIRQYAVRGESRMGLAEAYQLAAAWLAEHPADDDNPVDEAWLRSVGFDRHLGSWFSPTSKRPGPACRVSCAPEFGCDAWSVQNDGGIAEIPPLETRGLCRRLCASLGIPMNEPT